MSVSDAGGALQPSDPAQLQARAATITAKSCRLRYAARAVPAPPVSAAVDAAAPIPRASDALPQVPSATEAVPVPEADPLLATADGHMGPGRPIKPVADLVRGEFKLTHFRHFVAPPALLPSTRDDAEAEGSSSDGEGCGAPLSRAEILAAMSKDLKSGALPVTALGDGQGSQLYSSTHQRRGGERGRVTTDVDGLD